MARLSEEKEQRQAKIGPFLNFNYTWTDTDLKDLLYDLASNSEKLVALDIFKSYGWRIQKVNSL